MAEYFLRLEAVNIDNFIGDTQNVSTIRGGSLLLLRATDGLEDHFPANRGFKPITTGASIGLYSFEAGDEGEADAVRQQVSEWIGQKPGLRYATIVVNVQPAGSHFVRDVEALTARNRWQQMQTLSTALDSAPFHKVCEVDKVRPAVDQVEIGTERKWVSESVRSRRGFGVEMKRDFYRQETGRGVVGQFVWDLEELSNDPSKGNLHHKIAIIYLDGNGFGRIKRAAGTRVEWQRFDETVKTYRRHMLSSLIDVMNSDPDWETQGERYRIETLLWGGDELIWVVPAWKGLQTLSYFYRASERWVFNNQPLLHAGGIVFCHHNAPIHRLTRLARALADEAKYGDGRSRNQFAYEVLESFDHTGSDFEAYRRSRCVQALDRRVPDTPSLLLDPAKIDFLRAQAPTLRERLPRRKLHDVVAELLSPLNSTNDSDLALRSKDRAARIHELNDRLKRTGMKEPELRETEDCLGAETCWLHLNNLWDYLT